MKTLKELRNISQVLHEDGHTDIASARRTMKLIHEAAYQIDEVLKSMGEKESLPTWWMNKIHAAKMNIDTASEYIRHPDSSAVEESFIVEGIVDRLKAIADSKDEKKIKLMLNNNVDIDLDAKSARVILKTYNSLNSTNKKKMEQKMMKDEQSFLKVLDFAFDNNEH